MTVSLETSWLCCWEVAARRGLEGVKRAGGDKAFLYPSFQQVLPCLLGPLPFLSLSYSHTPWLFPASRVQLDSCSRHSRQSSTSLPELEGRLCC